MPLGEAEVRQYLDQLLTVAVANGITGRAEPVGPVAEAPAAGGGAPNPRYARRENAVGAGDLDGAIAAYEELLQGDPERRRGEGRAGPGPAGEADAGRRRPTSARGPPTTPTDIEAQLLVADVDLMGGHVDDAFARLIKTIQTTAGDERDTVRLHLLELFEVVGADDERVVKARRRLMAALF